jgi:uncharacterized membrane protein YjfL (UPF0719 family)
MERCLIAVAYILAVLLFLYAAKQAADRLTRFDDDAAIEKEGNMAVAMRRFGLYLGISISLAGILSSGVALSDIPGFFLAGLVVLVLFFIAYFGNNYVVMKGIGNNELVQQGNLATGLIEAGSFLASGILLNGAFTGEGGGLAGAAVFFFAGELLMFLAVMIHQKLYFFDLVEEVRRGNTSAGISVAGVLVSYSLILRSSIAGDFMGWRESFPPFLVTAVTGIVLMLVFQKVADLLFLPRTTYAGQIRNGNAASLVLAQGVALSLSLVISRMVWF